MSIFTWLCLPYPPQPRSSQGNMQLSGQVAVRARRTASNNQHERAAQTASVPAVAKKISEKPTKSDYRGLATSTRPAVRRRSPSDTETLLHWITTSLPPRTTSLLLAELSKPFSPADKEGYIYIFRLTSASTVAPRSDSHPSSNVLLKIGSTSNVYRRLNEWTRQCNYSVSLLRYYPYESSASGTPDMRTRSSPSSPSPRKVPFMRRVERLIHIQLAEMQMKHTCGVCGTEHREWFSVPNTRAGLGAVHEIIKRWVTWGEEQQIYL
ncbi:MAG: hypothetical protein M1838_006250 [Thelocarpon superellum]|nr:MAG: hypothetical protein M1838_006250 [Thelocarpon superellum]